MSIPIDAKMSETMCVTALWPSIHKLFCFHDSCFLGFSAESFLAATGPDRMGPDGKWLIFEGNHRLYALRILSERINAKNPTIEGRKAAWQRLAMETDEAGVPLVPINCYSSDMPVELTIELAHCK
jgi:hypothetical protein